MKNVKTLTLAAIVFSASFLLGVAPIEARGESRGSTWVPTIAGGSYMVDNNWMRLVADSGFDNQGPSTIVNAHNKWLPGWPDGMWYGEYEYISIDGGTTWTWLKIANGFTRSLVENVLNKDYTITLNTAGTPLATLSIKKRIVISNTEPKASITYTIGGPTGTGPVRLYYSPDFCDWETTRNRWDKIYDTSWAQVMTSGWYQASGLIVDTLGSGSWLLRTGNPRWFYAGYWWRALYGPSSNPSTWTTGDDIHIWDLGIGVILEFGILSSEVSESLDHPDDPTTGTPQTPDWEGPSGEPAQPTVGGLVVPADKVGLLAPYIGLASTISAATITIAIYVKHIQRRKEKQ